MNLLINVVLMAISVYMFYRVFKLSARGKLNRAMLAILDQIDERDTFFEQADAFIAEQKDAEYVQKVSVLRLWGDTFYARDAEFKEHLEALNIDLLLNPDGKNKGYDPNEDSFFYLYCAIPNRLYYRKADGLRELLDEKLSAYADTNKFTLLRRIYEENRKFYSRTEDSGKTFITSLLEGDYGGFKYSKQLIGLYKHCEEAILAVLYQEEGNTEEYDNCIQDLKDFGTNTRLGKRWLSELGISLPVEESETDEEEEAVTEEETKEEETE
ncbi:MAG: hypothetical protein IJ225_00335 [Solobacterium sp.]|nr:hypothetical protein [Solobacterium sp.]